MAEKKTAAKATAKTAAKPTEKPAEKPVAKPVKADAKAQPRLKELYNKEFKAKLAKELNLANINQVPELKKVVVSCGVGKKREDKRFTETVALTLGKITGQAPTSRLAKKSIATFKIRKGMGAPIGYLVTLRNDKMYEFVDRLINVALPHVRDFHGVSRAAFDQQGNYNLGIKEQTVFPEITFEDASVLHGLEVTFIIKNGSKEGSLKLLELFGMPFEREGK
ncbi:50S ribosomal protein L5 [Candidatus Saccharibacteria bacterium]|nr:50S ribosomal protein L5 [Candidatus Saccharibacteria bacterium]